MERLLDQAALLSSCRWQAAYDCCLVQYHPVQCFKLWLCKPVWVLKHGVKMFISVWHVLGLVCVTKLLTYVHVALAGQLCSLWALHALATTVWKSRPVPCQQCMLALEA